MGIWAVKIADQRGGGDGVGAQPQFLGEPELLGVDLGEEVAVDLVEALAGVGVTGEGGVGEEGVEVEIEEGRGAVGLGSGRRIREEDLGAVGVVPGALLGVREDLVGMAELLEGGGGVGGGDGGGGGGELVGMELEGEALVGGADLVLGAVAMDSQDLVETPLPHLRHVFVSRALGLGFGENLAEKKEREGTFIHLWRAPGSLSFRGGTRLYLGCSRAQHDFSFLRAHPPLDHSLLDFRSVQTDERRSFERFQISIRLVIQRCIGVKQGASFFLFFQRTNRVKGGREEIDSGHDHF